MGGVQEYVSLRDKNTFGLAATARWYAEVESAADIVALREHPAFGERLVLGGGSNLVLTRDWPGLVIKVAVSGIEVHSETETSVTIKVGGGENWHGLVMHCVARGWSGLENLALIPGTVGAAPVQNIGAYGVELKETLVSVDTVDLASGSTRALSRAECEFGYRDSVFKHALKDRVVITHVTFRLNKNAAPNTSYAALADELARRGHTQPTPAQVAEAVIAIRQSKLPDPAVLGNAGSFFKNPVVSAGQAQQLKAAHPAVPVYPQPDGTAKLAAGWLIEQSGLKGYTVPSGHAGVHAKQALVLVNYGGATGDEILALAAHVQRTVEARFGVRLEREVNVI